MDTNFSSDLQQPILDDDDDGKVVKPDGTNEKKGDNDGSETADVLKTPPREETVKKSAASPSSKRRHHLGLKPITEFEHEAETLIVSAIEKETAAEKRRESLKNFPYAIPDKLADRFESDKPGVVPPNQRSQSKQSDDLSTTTVQLQALQNVLSGDKDDGSETSESKKTDSTGRKHAVDMFADNAQVMMAANKLRNRKSKQKHESEDNVDSTETKPGGTPATKGTENADVEDIEAGPPSSSRGNTSFQNMLENVFIEAPIDVVFGAMGATKQLGEDWELFGEFVRPRTPSLKQSIFNILVYAVLPSLALGALLFYGCGNPSTGTWPNGTPPTGASLETASISWWIIFIGIRQALILSLARATEFVLIQYTAVQSPVFARMAGPNAALMVSQSEGWPCILFFFGLYDFFLLQGEAEFYHHWLFWQDVFDMLNATNPSGDVVTRELYARFLGVFMLVGVTVTVKRFCTGRHLGRRLVAQYGEQLTQTAKDMLLLISVAFLSRNQTVNADHAMAKEVNFDLSEEGPDETNAATEVEDPSDIIDLIEQWDEPTIAKNGDLDKVSIKDILQFQKVSQFMEAEYPFSIAFGPASTRELCLTSAEEVYSRLLRRQDGSDQEGLKFETLTQVAVGPNDEIDKDRVEDLKRVFHPDKDGRLSTLDFCTSCDTVYKTMRMLSASIHSASQIERAYEKIINLFFYIVLGTVILPILGVDVWSFYVALSSFIIAFAFMIGNASSQYFEGILLILCRKPYDVGDKIAVGDVDEESNPNGSSGWVVEKIDLFTTTVRFVKTREVATLTNGSVARSRIINMNRSDQAQVMVYMKFGVDVPYSKINVLRKAVESYIKDRPREWVELSSFRSTRVESDLGFIEYVISLKHRESWQKALVVLESKARVSSLCLELQKQLEMRYTAPALPVDLALTSKTEQSLRSDEQDGKAQGTESVEEPAMDESATKTPESKESMEEGVRDVLSMFEAQKTSP